MDPQVSIDINDYEITDSDSEIGASNRIFSEKLLVNFDGLLRLRNDCTEYCKIRNCFVSRMGINGVDDVVIHRNLFSDVMGKAKLEVFRIFCKAVAEKRGGDANVKCAWYGGSKEEVSGIVSCGFGGNFIGNGIVLSPAHFPVNSVWRAIEDENGVRHMLLCRVILGNTELVSPGSDQIQPSSSYFDSGVDNLLAPRKYIMWKPYMNSHIFPNYIISFKTGLKKVGLRSNSPSMKLPILLHGLSKFMQPSQMGLIVKYYHDFQGNKISRTELIRHLRVLAGDKLLISVIKLCTNRR